MTANLAHVPIRLRLPRWPLAPALGTVVMVVVAGAALWLRQQTGWPGLAPLSSLGHGLTAGLLVVVGMQWLACSREARFLEAGQGQPSAWMQRALRTAPTDARLLSALRSEASTRWVFLFLLGCALVPLGLVASLEQLPPPGGTVSLELKPYLPLGLALLEAVLVVLAARALDGQWQDFVASWSCYLPPTPTPVVTAPPAVEEKADSLEELFGAGDPKEAPAQASVPVPSVDELPLPEQGAAKQFWWPTVK